MGSRRSKQSPAASRRLPAALLSLIATSSPLAMAQNCVSLAGSTMCPAFSSASVSTGLSNLFPFLSSVTSTNSFDAALGNYITTAYAQEKYGTLFGCSKFNPQNTTGLYARYTASFICNAVVQNSIDPCGLSAAQSRPLCADACSEFAISEQSIVANPKLCGQHNSNTIQQLRADFTNCALPANALSGNCISGVSNEPDNCGFSSNLASLCSYCAQSTVNATDSCCISSNVNTRCKNVKLPTLASLQPLFTSTSTSLSSASQTTSQSSATSSAAAAAGGSGLSGGAIAGIVIGAIAALILLILLIYFGCVYYRRQRYYGEKTALNQPSPPRSGKRISQASNQPRFEALPGSRVTRMSALESSESEAADRALPTYQQSSSEMESSPGSDMAPGVMGGAAAAAAFERRRKKSNSDSPNDSSNYSTSGGEFSTPEDRARQSEQMPFFKDYYSDEDIHPGDEVSTLWAYQPQAPDEFELERGDMLRIVGIWDDGWATGVRISDRAEDYDPDRSAHRDSGVSNGSKADDSPPANGDLKAFPLVCVCLPAHWKKTLEGDQSNPDADAE